MNTNRLLAAGYVGGIIDGEGSVDANPNRRCIRIANTDIGIIEAYEEALSVLDIRFTRTVRPAKGKHLPVFNVTIWGRRYLETIQREVPLAPRKKALLDTAVSSFVLAHYYRKHEITREQLEGLVADGLTGREIAVALGLASHSHAQHHLQKHGLTTHRGQKRRSDRVARNPQSGRFTRARGLLP